MSLKPSSRTRQRETTRRHLVEAGLRVVTAHGFAGATTAAIAAASGRAHGTVFVHFATRDALVTELVEEIGSAISQLLAKMPELPAISEVLDAHLSALARNEALYAQLLREATQLPAAARARLFALQSGIVWRLRTAHSRDVALGLARATDSSAIANMWIALTNHYVMNRDVFAPGESVIASRGAMLKAQLLEIIRP